MRKKFTMLLASLFLTLGTAKAELVDDGVYAIVNKANSTAIAENNSTHKLFSATRDANNYRQLWLLETGSDGKYTLRNAVSGRYVKVINGLYNIWETANESMELYVRVQTAATGEAPDYYYITSQESPATTGYAPCAHSSNGNIVGWTHTADASQWDFVSQSEIAISTLVENVKQDLSSDITLAESLLDNTVLEGNTELHNSLSTASSTVKALGNDDLSAALDAAVALRTAIASAETFINTIVETSQLANNEYYKLYGYRGFIYAADGVLKGTNAVNVAYDANNMNQHFAIIKKNDKYYLYNVGAKKFVIKSGNNTTLVDLPEQPITLESTGNADYAWSIKLNGTNKINLSTGWNSYGVYTDYNGDDEGNRWTIYRVGTFDNNEALAAFDKVYVTVNYVLGSKKTVTQKNAMAKGETFSFSNPYVYTSVTSCTKGDETLTANNGTYSFEVTEATTVTVNLEEQLPFTLSENYENAVWYRLKIRPNNNSGNTPKWVVRKAEKPYDNVTTAPTDNNGLWAFVGNAIDGVQVLNKEAGANQTLGFDGMNTDNPAYMKEGTTTWTLGKLAKDGYEGFLLRQGTTGNNYLHDYSSKLAFWNNSGAPTDLGSAFIAEAPLSITYLYKGEELTDYKVDTYVNYGTVHTITNPFASAKKYISIGECATTGSQPVNTDGTWSVKVTEATSITVTLVDDLPFKVSESYANATWYYMNIRSDNKKYVAMSDATEYSNVAKPAADDKSLWAFMGDVNGIKIINKAAGEGKTLSFEGEAAGDKAVVMREEEKTWTIEQAATGFLLRAGNTGNLYVHDLNGKLKIWNSTSAPTDKGSAFNVVEDKGVKSLEDLALSPRYMNVYTIQAERSPLLYDANAEHPTKLSSGMVSGIAANENDINQQFLILRTPSTPEGYFYLYNLGAEKFVDENLNFIDFPSPVLSLVASEHPAYPWQVKIDDKFVIPGDGGTDGNKIHHTADGEDDDGKRYRIVKVGEYDDFGRFTTIEEAEDMIKATSELSNEKVYTVSTVNGGYWYYNSEKDALWSTGKAGVEFSAQDPAQQIAFLTVSGHTYIYSIGAQKFVVKAGGNTAYSDVPSQSIELLDAEGSRFYPFVAAFVDGDNRHHIGISNGYDIPVITHWNDLNDNGNKIKLREVTPGYMAEGAADLLAAAVAKIDNYLAAQELKPELATLIEQAEALLAKNYLNTEDATSLTNVKNAAKAVYDEPTSASDALTEQINLLTEAIAAIIYVTEVADFKNCYLYTFVSERGWMVATEEDATVKSTDEGAADNTLHQWAVYKSANNNYYLYNIGKQQFMGFANAQDAEIPFAATPQMTTLTFKKSNWKDYPIMFSVDDLGAVNIDRNGNMIYWAGGWTDLEDGGNNHKVTVVGAVPSTTLTAIESKVVFFEATHALDVAIAAVQAKVDVMNKLGYYSSSNENLEADFNTIKTFKEAITAETTVDAINAQTTAANNLVATFTVLNVPQAGKFYRIQNYGQSGYLNSGASGRTQFSGTDNKESIFCFVDNKLVSYTTGMSLAIDGNNKLTYNETVGAGVTIKFEESRVAGKLQILFNDTRYLFSENAGNSDSGDTKAKYIDPAGGSPAGRNANYLFTVTEVETLPVTVSAVGYATLYAPVALQIPQGVTAYIGVKEDNYLTLTDITEVVTNGIIPANTGVVLESQFDEGEEKTAKTFNFTVVDDVAPIEASKNLLVGAYPRSAKNPDKKVYTLQNGDNGVGFYLFKGYSDESNQAGTKTYINGFRAWVELDADAPARALAFRFRGKEQGTTEIEVPAANDLQPAVIYDLTGRRITEIVEKGIYIVNGKKVVIK